MTSGDPRHPIAGGAAASRKTWAARRCIQYEFLIYSFDVKVAGKPGIEEILVDAGSGKVLAHEHESDAAEKKDDAAKEKQEDAAAEKKEKGGK